jgi:hypothetical protein
MAQHGKRGSYDDLARLVRKEASAQTAIVIILDGRHGSGMSEASIDHQLAPSKLAELLRLMASRLEGGVRADGVETTLEVDEPSDA